MSSGEFERTPMSRRQEERARVLRLPLDEDGLKLLVDEAVNQTIQDEGQGLELKRIGTLIASMAFEARRHSISEHASQRRWQRWNWFLGGGSAALAAVVAGGVLAGEASQFRYIVGAVAFLSAALGGLVTFLNIAQKEQAAATKHDLYELFSRSTSHYLITTFPSQNLEEARASLENLTKQFMSIGQTVSLPSLNPAPAGYSPGQLRDR